MKALITLFSLVIYYVIRDMTTVVVISADSGDSPNNRFRELFSATLNLRVHILHVHKEKFSETAVSSKASHAVSTARRLAI